MNRAPVSILCCYTDYRSIDWFEIRILSQPDEPVACLRRAPVVRQGVIDGGVERGTLVERSYDKSYSAVIEIYPGRAAKADCYRFLHAHGVILETPVKPDLEI